MIPKSGHRFSEKIMRKTTTHARRDQRVGIENLKPGAGCAVDGES